MQRAWADRCDAEYKNGWEQARAIVMATITPHMDKRHRKGAEELMPLPWDKDQDERSEREDPAAEKRESSSDWRVRAEALAKRLGVKTTKDGKQLNNKHNPET